MGDPTELIGKWNFERFIDDRRSGSRSSASGSCELVLEGADLILWREHGMLRHAGLELPTSRDLRIERGNRDDGATWHVTFDDGRYFHPWLPGEMVEHPCGADHYEGFIELIEATGAIDSWRVRWRVRGPDKDLRIETLLSRARDCDARQRSEPS